MRKHINETLHNRFYKGEKQKGARYILYMYIQNKRS